LPIGRYRLTLHPSVEKQEESLRLQRLIKLSELSVLMSGEPGVVFEQAVRLIGELFQVRTVCLSTIVGNELLFTAVYAEGNTFRDAGRCQLDITPCATVERTKDPRVFDRVMEQFPQASFLKDHAAYAYCGFPALDGEGRVIAVTCLLDDKPHEFTVEDRALLRAFGQRIAAEIERGRVLAERQRLEQSLHAERSHLRQILDSQFGFIAILSPDGMIEAINQTPLTLMNLRKDEVLGCMLWDVDWVQAGTTLKLEGAIRSAVRGETLRLDIDALCPSIGHRIVDTGVSPLRDLDGRVTGAVAFGVDITERTRSEQALLQSEARLREAHALAHLGNWSYDLGTKQLLWSDEVFRIFEIDPDNTTPSYDLFLESTHPDDRMLVHETYQTSVRERTAYSLIHRILMPDGRIKHVRDRGETVYDQNGHPERSIGTIQDMTERRMAELHMEEALRQNTLSLREVHHRMKNNLQLISSLMHFQSKKVRDAEGMQAFRDGQDRLKSMLLIHEHLCRAEDLERIEFGDYVRALAEGILHSYGLIRSNASLRVVADPMSLPLATALPAGMIINELLTNACKYAFPNSNEGAAQVCVIRKDREFESLIEDNGMGFPQGMNLDQPVTFGLQLVRGLVSQLGGTITFQNEQGARVRVRMPLPPCAER